MNVFRTAIAALIFSSSSLAMAADVYISGDQIQTVSVGLNAGVTFSYDPGEGGDEIEVLITGPQGSDCLRMFMYFNSLKKESPDTFGLGFTINKTKKTCTMQLKAIGA